VYFHYNAKMYVYLVAIDTCDSLMFPEDGNLIAETYVGVTNITYFVNNSFALFGLT
jgi:hypothetical protein